MDQRQTRFEALEQRTHTVQRQLHWWRRLAGGLLVLVVLTWGLPVVTADDAKKDVEQRVAALEQLLKHFRRDGNQVIIKGANLRIVNGLGETNTTNGLGNLIVGYNEPRDTPEGGENPNVRTGSHNVVVGQQHNFSRFGGLVVGNFNDIRGEFAVVSGGEFNMASGYSATVSGGQGNIASEGWSSVSGGAENRASGLWVLVSGGSRNTASGDTSSVSGGIKNTAEARGSSISGGTLNRTRLVPGALPEASSISGGSNNVTRGIAASVSGGENNEARGLLSSVSAGENNVASGIESSISGGKDITVDTEHGWAAGSFGGEVSGSFRSP